MIIEELETRGISFSGDYNHDSSYYDGCDILHSELHIAGNCLNNNTEVYCVILGDTPPYNAISSSSILKVPGNFIHCKN